MSANLSSSEIRTSGEVVTTTDNYGGLGIGYLVNGQVYVTGGFWAVKAEQDVFQMVSYKRDGGAEYRATAKRMTGIS